MSLQHLSQHGQRDFVLGHDRVDLVNCLLPGLGYYGRLLAFQSIHGGLQFGQKFSRAFLFGVGVHGCIVVLLFVLVK